MNLKIVSLSPIVTETLVLLGVEDEIIGITPYCKRYLNDPTGKAIVGTCTKVNYEKLSRLRPDIIFTMEPVQNRLDEELRSKGYMTFKVRAHTNVHTILSNIVDIGLVTNRIYEARELALRLEERIERVYMRTRKTKSRPKVFVDHLWSYEHSTTFGALSYINDGLWIAGGINVFHDKLIEFFEPNYDEVLERDPDIVLVSFDPIKNITIEKYLNLRPKMRLSKAYRKKAIYLIPETKEVNLSHPGPSFVNTIEYLEGLFERNRST